MTLFIVGMLVGLVVGAGAVFAFMQMSARNVLTRARAAADQLRENVTKEAQNRAKEIELAAKQEQMKVRSQFERENESSRRKLEELEARLTKREDTLDRKLDTLSVKEKNLDDQERRVQQREKAVAAKDEQLTQVLKEQRDRLLQITGLSPDQAREMLLKRVEDEVKYEAGQTSDDTVSTVTIPSDDMKGRVIGREGRNIRSFEKTTGVDVIIDDTPGVVVVSCFDPVRREVARMSLERLVQDGRIHPARIEEVVAATSKEMEEELLRIGKEAVQEAQLTNGAKPIVPMLGRLAFRTSYGQNVLRHSMEVAYLAQTMADELGLDGNIARRAGLLHDIGKAMDHETEGGHPQIGMEFLKKFNESEAVLNACEGH